jgi:hypothetical protein
VIYPKGLSQATQDIIGRAAEALLGDTGAVAVMLTGPHALGVDRAEDKIYLVAITDNADGVIEHRFADRYAGVDRSMEIGIFPKRFISKLTSDGYWDMVSLRAAEVLRIAVPLVDPTGFGASAAEAMARHLPEKRFISGKIHGIKATFDDAVSLYSKGDYAGAVLVVREALRLAAELALKQAQGKPEAADATLSAALGEEAYGALVEGLGIKDMTEAEARRHLESLTTQARRLLQDLGIADDLLAG